MPWTVLFLARVLGLFHGFSLPELPKGTHVSSFPPPRAGRGPHPCHLMILPSLALLAQAFSKISSSSILSLSRVPSLISSKAKKKRGSLLESENSYFLSCHSILERQVIKKCQAPSRNWGKRELCESGEDFLGSVWLRLLVTSERGPGSIPVRELDSTTKSPHARTKTQHSKS